MIFIPSRRCCTKNTRGLNTPLTVSFRQPFVAFVMQTIAAAGTDNLDSSNTMTYNSFDNYSIPVVRQALYCTDMDFLKVTERRDGPIEHNSEECVPQVILTMARH